jgi:hypothetical protein
MNESDVVNKIEAEGFEPIAYSTLEQIKIRKAIETHNRLLMFVAFLFAILIVLVLTLVWLGIKTQTVGIFLHWLSQLRIR